MLQVINVLGPMGTAQQLSLCSSGAEADICFHSCSQMHLSVWKLVASSHSYPWLGTCDLAECLPNWEVINREEPTMQPSLQPGSLSIHVPVGGPTWHPGTYADCWEIGHFCNLCEDSLEGSAGNVCDNSCQVPGGAVCCQEGHLGTERGTSRGCLWTCQWHYGHLHNTWSQQPPSCFTANKVGLGIGLGAPSVVWLVMPALSIMSQLPK